MADQEDLDAPALQRDIRQLREEMGVHVGNLLQGIQSINAYLHGGAMDIIANAPGQHAAAVHELQTLHDHARKLYEEARRLHENDANQVQEISKLHQHAANLIRAIEGLRQELVQFAQKMAGIEKYYLRLEAECGARLSSLESEVQLLWAAVRTMPERRLADEPPACLQRVREQNEGARTRISYGSVTDLRDGTVYEVGAAHTESYRQGDSIVVRQRERSIIIPFEHARITEKLS